MPRARRARSTASPAPRSTRSASCRTARIVRNPDELRARAAAPSPVPFVQNVTERLLMYALGRVIEAHDMPFVRDIVRRSAADDYRFSSLILNIVKSDDFQKRHRAAGRRRARSSSKPPCTLRQQGRVTMFITKKHLSRRTVLRGVGAAISLPLLDAMIPAGHRARATPPRSRRRAWASSTSRTARS